MAMMIIIILATCAELHNLNTAKQTPFVRVRGHLAGATWTTCWRGGGGGGRFSTQAIIDTRSWAEKSDQRGT